MTILRDLVIISHINGAHKETFALLRSTQTLVRRKHHVPAHSVPSTAFYSNNLDNRITLLYQYAWSGRTAVILLAPSCHLQVTMVIDFGRDL